MIGRFAESRTRVLLLALMGYSLTLLPLSVLFGLATGDIYKGYLQKPNWFLFPLFWLPVVYLYRSTWDQFIASWKDLFANGCVVNSGDGGVPACRDAFVNHIDRYRKYILILSSLLAVVIMALDTADLVGLYLDPPDHVYLLEGEEGSGKSTGGRFLAEPQGWREVSDGTIPLPEVTHRVEDASWTEAWLFRRHPGEKNPGKWSNLIFVCLAYTQQYIIIVVGVASLFHIWAHLALFVWFDSMSFARRHGVVLRLDPYSSIREFGLERWNQALNMIYWALSPALVIPIVSKASQSATGASDMGQKMIQWLVPLLFLSPMLFTIIARQKKVMALWSVIRQEEDRDKIEAYHKQLLWPLDRNWASKLGIIIAFSLLVFLVGDMLTEIGVDKLIK